MDNENSLAFVLKTIRLERGMSLREFGDALGISHAYLSKLEKGFDSRSGKEITPTIEVLTKMAEHLEIPTKEFLERCGYLKSSPPVPTKPVKSCQTVDLQIFMEETIAAIQSAEHLTCDGRILSNAEREMITDAIEISVELARKKLKAK